MSVFSATGVGVNSAFGGADNGQGGQQTPHPALSGREPIRVAIVDDEEPERVLLQDILTRSGRYECAGSYASGEEALRQVPAVRPNLVLMDIRMPGISGIDCMRLLKLVLPGLIVVLVSGLIDAESVSQALDAGGDGYLTKPFTVAQCLAMLTLAFHRNVTGARASGGVDVPSARGIRGCTGLTERENEVMGGLAKGLLYKEIAGELGISFSTVNKHQHNIFLKLHVSNRTEAIVKWLDSRGF